MNYLLPAHTIPNEGPQNPQDQSTQPEHSSPDSLEEIAYQINTEHQELQKACSKALIHAYNTGQLLIKAKGKLKQNNQHWLPWLQDNCPFAEKTAQNYMRIAKDWETIEKSANIADLGVAGALSLLAKAKKQQRALQGTPSSTDPTPATTEFTQTQISLRIKSTTHKVIAPHSETDPYESLKQQVLNSMHMMEFGLINVKDLDITAVNQVMQDPDLLTIQKRITDLVSSF